eukprot:720064-Heterocapsa_arctica.AAC.1
MQSWASHLQAVTSLRSRGGLAGQQGGRCICLKALTWHHTGRVAYSPWPEVVAPGIGKAAQ